MVNSVPLSSTDTLKSLKVWHPHFESAFKEAYRCIELGTPALILGCCSGLSLLAKTLETAHSNSLAIQVPCSPTESTWQGFLLQSLQTLEESEGKDFGTKRSASIKELEITLLRRLKQNQKNTLILDDASNLFSLHYQNRTKELEYLKYLLNSGTNCLLEDDWGLLGKIFASTQFPLSRRLSIIQLPSRYKGEKGLRAFQEILELFRPYLTLKEGPEFADFEFFCRGSLTNLPLLKDWFIRALEFALESNANSVQMRHFEETVLSVSKRKKILSDILLHEKVLEEILGLETV